MTFAYEPRMEHRLNTDSERRESNRALPNYRILFVNPCSFRVSSVAKRCPAIHGNRSARIAGRSAKGRASTCAEIG